MDPFNRHQAPFPAALWERLDGAAAARARERLTVRRYLELDGPFGLGLTAIETGNDELSDAPAASLAEVVLSRTLPVPALRRGFKLSLRRIAAHFENGHPLDLSPVEDAAEAVADREEELLYYGQPGFHLAGLLTHERRQQVAGGDWQDLSRALDDVLAAATLLDAAGHRGPYALALAPPLYNGLFRLYPGSDVQQLDHLKSLATCGIHKAPIEGAALVDPRAGTIIIGQDLRAGFERQDGVLCHLYLTESLVVRIDDPAAVCLIGATGRNAAVSE